MYFFLIQIRRSKAMSGIKQKCPLAIILPTLAQLVKRFRKLEPDFFRPIELKGISPILLAWNNATLKLAISTIYSSSACTVLVLNHCWITLAWPMSLWFIRGQAIGFLLWFCTCPFSVYSQTVMKTSSNQRTVVGTGRVWLCQSLSINLFSHTALKHLPHTK